MDEARRLAEAACASDQARALEALLRPLIAYEDDARADSNPTALCGLLETGSLAQDFRHAPDLELRTLLDRAAKGFGSPRSPLPNAALTRHYAGPYFSYRQTFELDCLLARGQELARSARDTWTAAILGAASDCVSSVGSQFAQPVRPRATDGRVKPHAVELARRKRRISVAERFLYWIERYDPRHASSFDHEIHRADYQDFLSSAPRDVAAAYADPPYTRDHYSRFYHVLETIALGDDPALGRWARQPRTPTSRGLYRLNRHQSPFCIKSQAPAAFDALFAGVRRLGAPLVLSYSPLCRGEARAPAPGDSAGTDSVSPSSLLSCQRLTGSICGAQQDERGSPEPLGWTYRRDPAHLSVVVQSFRDTRASGESGHDARSSSAVILVRLIRPTGSADRSRSRALTWS